MGAIRRFLVMLRTKVRAGARLAVGVPDYAAYVEHLRQHHPDREPPSYAAFFRERQDARYGKGRVRCC
jgi:uncharacterized short protein YbdD (DUF466 family)